MLTYVAASFGDFFDRSLHWMERIFSRNPDCARDVFKEDRFS